MPDLDHRLITYDDSRCWELGHRPLPAPVRPQPRHDDPVACVECSLAFRRAEGDEPGSGHDAVRALRG